MYNNKFEQIGRLTLKLSEIVTSIVFDHLATPSLEYRKNEGMQYSTLGLKIEYKH